jgi:hypothetical protein
MNKGARELTKNSIIPKHTHKYAITSLALGIADVFLIGVWSTLVYNSILNTVDLTFTLFYSIFLVLSTLAIVYGSVALVKIKQYPVFSGRKEAIYGIIFGFVPLAADIWLFINSTFFKMPI